MGALLVPYDRLWPVRYEEIAEEIRRLGDGDWLVEHIGSTAVQGMPAKPIIDLAVRIRDDDDFDRYRLALEQAGWSLGSGITTHRVMVFTEAGIRTRIAHFFTRQDWDAVNQRILRDWLRQHPHDAARYLAAKWAAEAAAERGEGTYNEGKTAIIQEIVDRARAARGMPPSSAYDKAGDIRPE